MDLVGEVVRWWLMERNGNLSVYLGIDKTW